MPPHQQIADLPLTAGLPPPLVLLLPMQKLQPTPPICEKVSITTVFKSGIFKNGVLAGGVTPAVANLLVTLWSSALSETTPVKTTSMITMGTTSSTIRQSIIWILS